MNAETLLFNLRAAAFSHRRSRSCDWPKTCGACHFYSGGIEAVKTLLGDMTPEQREKRRAAQALEDIDVREQSERDDMRMLLAGRAAAEEGVLDKPCEQSGANSDNVRISDGEPKTL